MSVREEHRILHHLDDPLRVLYWTLDEAGCLIVMPYLGLVFNQKILGLALGIGGFFGLRFIKKRFGLVNLKHGLYWYFPHNHKKLPNTPPSYIREYF